MIIASVGGDRWYGLSEVRQGLIEALLRNTNAMSRRKKTRSEARLFVRYLVPRGGIEPPTRGFSIRRSRL
ncbi:hypothetical protein ThidrDRAFT_1188 [Thiorhodococcus drewsii AZ1]|uniref:Uncharacterized protein n=1 Tax=Thiorhodococcus drewsii AZ1 TaxID=765913 RepID=G2DYS6_9GAMM|nr:hypothetical protein ThidrDRAFT_1188 [Thiorhodococcus drewsii AZ1]